MKTNAQNLEKHKNDMIDVVMVSSSPTLVVWVFRT